MSASFARSRTFAHRFWAPAWLGRRPRPLRIALRALAIFVLVLFVIWLVLFVTKGRFLKSPFESIASSMLEREVEVGSDFNLYFAPFNIKFMAQEMRISNPEWARSDDFFTAELIDTRISTLPLIFGRREVRWIDLQGSRIALEWDGSGERNSWTFGDPNAPPEPFELPEIRRGTITGTEVVFRHPDLELYAEIGIDTVKATDTAFDSDIRFSGEGTMRDRPFTISGSLLSPNETIAGGRNRLTLHAEAARTRLDLSGTLPGATKVEGADLRLGVRGFNIADLFDFLGIAVPATRAYRLDSALTYEGEEWRFTDLKGVFGGSDIAGSLRIAMPDERLKLTADLSTNTLDIIDAGPFIGYDPERLDSMGGSGAIQQVNGRPRVLPDATLRIDAIGRFDADVQYHVDRVRAESVPITDLDLTLDLDHSLLKLAPVKANVAGGTLTADISLDAREPVVKTNYDIRLSPTPMGRLLARFGAAESGTSGTITARVQMRGRGDSLRQSLATADGRMAFIMPAGTLTTGNVQLAELDIGTFVQKMFEEELEDPIEINCGLIAFTVRDGIAAADPILIDTRKNVILGRGGFSFKNEGLDLAVRADAKTFSLFSGQSPVGVNGWFAQPAINPISGALVGRAGIGLGLAAVATPVGGLLAFVDPGDAKAAACGPVLSGAGASAQRTDEGEARDDVGEGTTAKSESGEQSDEADRDQREKFLGIF
jgi:uncharacterized protein involved in outer membrane biogenesis